MKKQIAGSLIGTCIGVALAWCVMLQLGTIATAQDGAPLVLTVNEFAKLRQWQKLTDQRLKDLEVDVSGLRKFRGNVDPVAMQRIDAKLKWLTREVAPALPGSATPTDLKEYRQRYGFDGPAPKTRLDTGRDTTKDIDPGPPGFPNH